MSFKTGIIIGEVKYGSFYFPIDFEIFNLQQSIPNAIFDTGCSHSLISVDSLGIGNKSIGQIKTDIFYNKDSRLEIGIGVETLNSELHQTRLLVNKVNNIKTHSKDNKTVEELINKYITLEGIELLQNSKNIRYRYKIKDLHIDKVLIGNYDVRLSFNTEVNLIGMHIIKDLYTKIYSHNGNIHLYAIKKEEDDVLDKIENSLNGIGKIIEV